MFSDLIRYYDEGGGSRLDILPFQIIQQSGFVPSVLASLVSGATASRTNGVVTITATGHGIFSGSMFEGFRFYYPGSPSLAAGWYNSILSVPDSNSLTFSAPGSNFSSESIHSGTTFTNTYVELASITIPGGTLKVGSLIALSLCRLGSITSADKALKLFYGNSELSGSVAAASAHTIQKITFLNYAENKQLGVGEGQGGFSTAYQLATVDTTVDHNLVLKASIGAVGTFLALYSANLELTTP